MHTSRMLLDAKKRVVAAVDAARAAGQAPCALYLHPDYAKELALNATQIDLDTDAWAPSKDLMIAELTHPDYDRNPARDDQARPKTVQEAMDIAAPQCQAALRRTGVKLQVVLDASMTPGALRIGSQQTAMQEA